MSVCVSVIISASAGVSVSSDAVCAKVETTVAAPGACKKRSHKLRLLLDTKWLVWCPGWS